MSKHRYKQRKTNRIALKSYLDSSNVGLDSVETLLSRGKGDAEQDFSPEDSEIYPNTVEDRFQRDTPDKIPKIDPSRIVDFRQGHIEETKKNFPDMFKKQVDRKRTKLSAEDEGNFGAWYNAIATRTGIDKDPDHQAQKFDYRGYYKEFVRGKENEWLKAAEDTLTNNPDAHLFGDFKDADHPTKHKDQQLNLSPFPKDSIESLLQPETVISESTKQPIDELETPEAKMFLKLSEANNKRIEKLRNDPKLGFNANSFISDIPLQIAQMNDILEQGGLPLVGGVTAGLIRILKASQKIEDPIERRFAEQLLGTVQVGLGFIPVVAMLQSTSGVVGGATGELGELFGGETGKDIGEALGHIGLSATLGIPILIGTLASMGASTVANKILSGTKLDKKDQALWSEAVGHVFFVAGMLSGRKVGRVSEKIFDRIARDTFKPKVGVTPESELSKGNLAEEGIQYFKDRLKDPATTPNEKQFIVNLLRKEEVDFQIPPELQPKQLPSPEIKVRSPKRTEVATTKPEELSIPPAVIKKETKDAGTILRDKEKLPGERVQPKTGEDARIEDLQFTTKEKGETIAVKIPEARKKTEETITSPEKIEDLVPEEKPFKPNYDEILGDLNYINDKTITPGERTKKRAELKHTAQHLLEQGINAKIEKDGKKWYLFIDNVKQSRTILGLVAKPDIVKIEDVEIEHDNAKTPFEDLPDDVVKKQTVAADLVAAEDLPPGIGPKKLEKGKQDIKDDVGKEQSLEAQIVRDAAEDILKEGQEKIQPVKGGRGTRTDLSAEEINRFVEEQITESEKTPEVPKDLQTARDKLEDLQNDVFASDQELEAAGKNLRELEGKFAQEELISDVETIETLGDKKLVRKSKSELDKFIQSASLKDLRNYYWHLQNVKTIDTKAEINTEMKKIRAQINEIESGKKDLFVAAEEEKQAQISFKKEAEAVGLTDAEKKKALKYLIDNKTPERIRDEIKLINERLKLADSELKKNNYVLNDAKASSRKQLTDKKEIREEAINNLLDKEYKSKENIGYGKVEDVKPTEPILDFGEKIGGARKDIAESGFTFTKKGKDKKPPFWMKGFQLGKQENGKYLPFLASEHGFIRWRSKQELDTEEEAITAVKLFNVAQKYRVTKKGEAYEVFRKVTNRKFITIKEGFKTSDDANRYIVEHVDELLNYKPTFPERPHIEDLQRTGKQFRKGNVSVEQFRTDFGFRGGEFGNWVPQDERQRLLNMSYDGLMDLADILDLPPQALSLGGKLSIAFGARGQGLSQAAAHYERDRAVFNLTRIKGAGSVAHEWFHALDNYFGLQSRGETLREGGEVKASKNKAQDYISYGTSYKNKVRKEVSDAFENVLKTIYKQPKIVEVSVDRYKILVERNTEYLNNAIKALRDYISKERSYGRKKKPATKEQLDQFDKLISDIRKGKLGDDAIIQTKERFLGQLPTKQVFKDLNELVTGIIGRSEFKRDRGSVKSIYEYVTRLNSDQKQLEIYQKNNKVERTTPTRYYYDARDIDRMRASDYWSTQHEMAARAFEAYVEDQIKKDNNLSQYLVHSTENSIYKILFDLNPYPEGVERERINTAFEKLFNTVKYEKSPDESVTEHETRVNAIEELGKLYTGGIINPNNYINAIKWGANIFKKGFDTFAKFSAQMIKDLGKKVKSILSQIWNKVKEIAKDIGKTAAEKIGGLVESRFNPARPLTIIDKKITDKNTTKKEPKSPGIEPLNDTPIDQNRRIAEQNEADPITLPAETVARNLQRKIQDKYNRGAQVINLIKKAGIEITEGQDFRLDMELYIGRATDKTVKMMDQVEEELLKPLADENFTVDDFGNYLYARHAPERNLKIEDEFEKENGSGMTDAEAEKIIEKYEGTVIEQLANKFDEIIIQPMRKEFENAGLVKEGDLDIYQHYVPLKGLFAKEGFFKETKTGTGKGFSVRSKGIFKARGRKSKAKNPFIQAITDYEQAILRSEKNKVGQTFIEFMRNNEDLRVIRPEGMSVPLWKEKSARVIPKYDAEGEIFSYESIDRGLADDEFNVWEDGKRKIITINDPILARVMKNLGQDISMGIIQNAADIFRKMATTYNPEFIIMNLLRDLQTGAITGSEKKIARKIVTGIPKAMHGVFQSIKKREGVYANLYEELKEAGGKVGWLSFETLEHKTKRFERKVLNYQKRGNVSKILEVTGEFMNDWNEIFESATRLSAYKVLRDQGISIKEASSYVKNLTVNFNKKGEWGTVMNTLYLFSNAGLQGTVRIAKATKSKFVRRFIYGYVAFNAMLAVLNSLIDEEEYEKIPDYVKDTNMIFMIGDGKFLKIRLPYGYNWFAVIGSSIGEVINGKNIGSQLGRAGNALVDAVNPMGAWGSFAQFITPTLADPIIQITTNKTFYGAPLKPEQPPYQPDLPESQLYFDNVRGTTKKATDFVYDITGDAVDVSPEDVDAFIDGYLSGVGKFVENSLATGEALISGEDLDPLNIPLWRQVYGRTLPNYEKQLIYEMWRNSRVKDYSPAEKERFFDAVEEALKTAQIDAGQKQRITRDFYKYQGETREEVIIKEREIRNLKRKLGVLPLDKKKQRDDLQRRIDKKKAELKKLNKKTKAGQKIPKTSLKKSLKKSLKTSLKKSL